MIDGVGRSSRAGDGDLVGDDQHDLEDELRKARARVAELEAALGIEAQGAASGAGRQGVFEGEEPLVVVPESLREPFARAQPFVSEYFRQREEDPLHGRLALAGERYILGGENLTLKQVLDLLSEVSGRPAPRFKTPYAVAYAFGAVDTALARMRGTEPMAPLDAIKMARHYMWFSSDKAREELGYAPRTAKTALKDAADWFLANGYVLAAA